jgi:hypothetical protein
LQDGHNKDGHNKEGATVKCFCLNEDTYRRISDEWRIATQRISPLMPPQLESYRRASAALSCGEVANLGRTLYDLNSV